MNDTLTIKKLFEEISKIEIEYNLFEKEIDGIYIWKLIRFEIYRELSKKLNLLQPPQTTYNDNRYIRLIKHFLNGTFNGPLTISNDTDVILFSHPRKVLTEGSQQIDIYSNYLEEKWRKEKTKYLVIERPHHGIFMRKSSKTVRYNEPLSLFTLWNFFKFKKDIDFLIDGLDRIANIPIENIETLSKENISSVIHAFKRDYHYYTKVLTKHRPKKIYIVVTYRAHALIAAATDLGIQTIEIQHGIMNPFAYRYPRNTKIPYFPTSLILWGEFWYDNAQMTINKKNIYYDGFPFLNKEIKKYSDIMQDASKVLFISQKKIGRSLVNIALDLAEKNQAYTVVYRLHPSEKEQWKTLYPKLYSASMQYNNITVEAPTDRTLYSSFAESKFVIGVNSTALIESLVLKCKLILVDLPGVEDFQDIIDKKLVNKVNSVEQLIKVIKEDSEQTLVDRDYFFKEPIECNKVELPMYNIWTIKKLFKEICRIETEDKLFEKEIDNIYIWKLIRFELFKELSEKLNLLQPPRTELIGNRYVRLMRHFLNGTFNGPLTKSNNTDVILFSHPRKVLTEDSQQIDIYSNYLEEQWKEEKIDYLVIERAHKGIFMRESSETVRYNESLSLFTLFNYLKPKKDVNFTIKGLNSIANIPIETIETLSKENISNVIHGFKREYNYYTKVFTKHKPKKIYIVVTYRAHALIAAATDLGIETIEIQHGIMNPFAYRYPEDIKIPYLTTKLILWGEFWYDNAQLGINKKNIFYDGFPFLNGEIKKYSDVMRNESRVLFISQKEIGRELVKIALEFANQNKEYKVVYRLHPFEKEQWEILYPKLYSSSMKKNNITIETATEKPLYRSFAESKFVIGVNSTALIESLAANCQPILVDLPGIENYQDIIDKKLVKKVVNSEELAQELKDNEQQMSIGKNYFFKEYHA